MTPSTLYTIGHSNHDAATFLQLLSRHAVTALADVRSSPYSRYTPHFNRELLRPALAAAGVSYVFLGDELGGRARDPAYHAQGRVSYEKLAKSPEFAAGLDRLLRGMQTHTVAIMCAEKDPLTCHRTILVARQMAERGVTVAHILEDGALESHATAEARLLTELKMPERDLFRGPEQILADAYRIRGEEISYAVEETRDHAGPGSVSVRSEPRP